MICQWCKGTGEECGCGEGFCTHCGATGEMADAPFGGDLIEILPYADVAELADYWCNSRRDETLGEFIQRVAMRTAQVLGSGQK